MGWVIGIVSFTCRFITSINGAFFPASDCYTKKQNLSLVHNLKRCICHPRSIDSLMVDNIESPEDLPEWMDEHACISTKHTE
jgi:hypothetical protein